MEKKQKELLILIALLPVLIIAVLSAVNSGGPKNNRAENRRVEPVGAAANGARDENKIFRSGAVTEPESRSAELRKKQLEIARRAAENERLWSRDPFLPVPTPTPSDIVPKIELQGIVMPASGKAWATINGKTFLEGDDCYGARVEKITGNNVILRYPDGSREILTLRRSSR